jgi:hypothetical protein
MSGQPLHIVYQQPDNRNDKPLYASGPPVYGGVRFKARPALPARIHNLQADRRQPI